MFAGVLATPLAGVFLFLWASFLEQLFTEIPPESEAAVQRCSVKKVFLEISQNSQENTCVIFLSRDSSTVIFCEICEISKNAFFYRTSLVAASAGYVCVMIFHFYLSNQ